MFKNCVINFLKMFLVVSFVGLCELGVPVFAMESDYMCEDKLYELDLADNNIRTVSFYDNVVKDIKIEKIVKTMCSKFENIILNYFCTQQERYNYRNKHKKDYSLGMEFDEFILKLNRNKCINERIIKKEVLDFLIGSYFHNEKNIKSTAREFDADRIFRLTFKGSRQGEQGVRIQFSPQLLAEKYRQINIGGTDPLEDMDLFKKKFDSPEQLRKLSFEICDYSNPGERIILGGNDLFYGLQCYFRNSEIKSCFDNEGNRKIIVLEDRMILEEESSGGCLWPKNKNERLFLRDGNYYTVNVYMGFENGQFGTCLFSTKVKAESVDYLYLDFDEMNKFLHPKTFDVILWFEYYVDNVKKLKR